MYLKSTNLIYFGFFFNSKSYGLCAGIELKKSIKTKGIWQCAEIWQVKDTLHLMPSFAIAFGLVSMEMYICCKPKRFVVLATGKK